MRNYTRTFDDQDLSAKKKPETPSAIKSSFSAGKEQQLDKFIKSCIENLVPNPSESKGENGCDVLAYFTTFSNILFDANYESDSCDYQSCSDEVFPKEIFLNPLFEEKIISIKIDPHHFDVESDLLEYMLNRDSFIISSSLKIESLLDEFVGELTLLKSIPSGIDKTDCYHENEIRLIKRLLYDNSSPRPPEEFVSENSDADIESFSPSPIPVEDSDSFIEEIDLSFTPDDPMPPSIEDDDYDSERDILIREELLDNYSFSFPVIESYHFDILSSSCKTTRCRFTWVFFLATKDETTPILKTFITCLENQLNLRVKVIKSDNGTDFKNSNLNQFCGLKVIKREFSVPRTPQQNGIAERKNRTLIEAARTMLADSLLPIPFWAEAVNTACYVQNRVLVTRPHNKTPYELLHGFQYKFNAEKVGEEVDQAYMLFPVWSAGSPNP
nr:putative ribonuclease H-like domain-containing protein [Tanacetum cinerariifolium]